MPYEVQTAVFEGPFDLLLHLILRSQLDIHEIHLAAIVDEYVAELERMHSLDLEVATEFVLIAATLVELKARSLLSRPEASELDEELAIWEHRDLLLSRLLACKTFRDASQELARMAAVARLSTPRRAGLEEPFVSLAPDLLAGVTPEMLRDACLWALAPKPVPRIDLDHVAPIRASVAEAVVELAEELERRGRTTFAEITAGVVERLQVVVRFLAILELYKQSLVDLDQTQTFGSIEIAWCGSGDGEGVATDLVDTYEG